MAFYTGIVESYFTAGGLNAAEEKKKEAAAEKTESSIKAEKRTVSEMEASGDQHASGTGSGSEETSAKIADLEVDPEKKARILKRQYESGMAPIKHEFIDFDHKRVLVEDFLPPDVVDGLKAETRTSEDGPPTKKQKKAKGVLKNRYQGKQQFSRAERLCLSIINGKGEECPYGDKCRFSHDLAAFMAKKPADLGKRCHLFDTLGRCPYGVMCCFAKSHIGDDFSNIVNEELWASQKKQPLTLNILPNVVQYKLRKKMYNFKMADRLHGLVQQKEFDKLAEAKAEFEATGQETDAGHGEADASVSVDPGVKMASDLGDKLDSCISKIKPKSPKSNSSTPKTSPMGKVKTDEMDSKSRVDDATPSELSGDKDPVIIDSDQVSSGTPSKVSSVEPDCIEKLPLFDATRGVPRFFGTDPDGIRIRPEEKNRIDFAGKLYLAPLTTVGNLPFRRVCKTLGADITCGEMAVVTNLLQAQKSEWALMKRHRTEDIFGVQLCGSYPDTMMKTAQLLMETCDIDFIDVNLGCPIDLIYKRGEGCAMMGRHGKLEEVVRGMSSVMGNLPLTVKIRTGIFEDKPIAHTLVPKLRDWGVAMTTMHGRSREQRYTKMADWDYISQCGQLADPMPMFGCGDVLSYEDANQQLARPGVSGLMIARGALIKPWIFTEIKEQRHWDISSSERFDILKSFVNFGFEHWGSDEQGVCKTRNFLLEWLSFLHRYIPVGILERVPQRINEKPPYFFGRNDLETLMASSNASDWVRITEMLLGKVPDGFYFVPKHKANAYK